MEPFDKHTAPLQGANMLEASAGTGKTFSLGLLVLRLILEKKVPVEKILMVTFTNAAAADLELRIREFVRMAHKHASGALRDISNKDIKAIMDNAGNDKLELLTRALLSLDDLAVFTINGFCQGTIGEYAFETDQSFDHEVLRDDSHILDNAVKRYVRETLNMLYYEQFKEFELSSTRMQSMREMLRKHLAGMEFSDSQEQDFDFSKKVNLARTRYIALKNEIENKFKKIKDTNIDARTKLAKSRSSPDLFLSEFIKACCASQPQRSLKNLNFIYEPFGREYAEAFLSTSLIYQHFFNTTKKEINKIKKKRGYISYDDQIRTVHAALKNEGFVEKLAHRYEAVFIDEFQDTDRFQYEIFSKVFNGKTLYFIGDPKQSIYGWRNADLDTYQKAKDEVGEQSVFNMENNYRSTPNLLDALESLLNPNGYNFFQDDNIKFVGVEAANKSIGKMQEGDKEVCPLTIWEFNTNDEESSHKAVAREVLRLLTGGFTIKKEKVKPRHIGILVREGIQGHQVKNELSRLGIPSVMRDDTLVLNTTEAEQIQYLLLALLDTRPKNIKRALNYSWFGFKTEEINRMDEKKHVERFVKLKKVLQNDGVYRMINHFLDLYDIRSRCVSDIRGQRVLTNVNHVAEVLHGLERQGKLSPEDLVTWMQRRGDNEEEFEQRLESDDDAVQISTIHKSKGLQYKIVFAPSLCMIPKPRTLYKGKVVSFKKDGKYHFTTNFPDLPQEDQAAHKDRLEQENRRLIYVTLTRASHKCYVSYIPQEGSKGKGKESSFDEIYTRAKAGNSRNIEFIDMKSESFDDKPEPYRAEEAGKQFTPRTPTIAPDSIKTTFRIHSFSSLNRTHHTTPFEQVALDQAYDHFVFQELSRGAKTGDALHKLFEHMQFNKEESWKQSLTDAAMFYPNIFKEEHQDSFKDLIRHCLKAEIRLDGEQFSLSSISDTDKIPELQFNFSVNKVNRQRINELLNEDAQLRGESDMKGLMTGYVDLLFRHRDKYYILDWKSNYLGNTLDDYGKEGLARVMKANNYELQYWIYTLAVKRWLESRLSGFDYDKHFGGVIYLFIRGIREGRQSGIHVNKPGRNQLDRLDEAFRE